MPSIFRMLPVVVAFLLNASAAFSAEVPLIIPVHGQPLAANVERLAQALDALGTPLPTDLERQLQTAGRQRDAIRLQELLDPHVLFVVSLNPELRVKVSRGPAKAELQQAGFTPVLVKVHNEGTLSRRLRIMSPQAGALYSGAALNSLKRQAQTQLNENENTTGASDRFLAVEMYAAPPMTAELSGLNVEYAIALIYSSESGPREAIIGFDVGAGTQDIGFRGEVPVLFHVRPAVPVKLSIRDHDGKPTVARLEFRDAQGHVYPPQAKRLAPDFFFQPQIYRIDGATVLLPPGTFTIESSRGPEYRVQRKDVTIQREDAASLDIQLERWIDPAQFGFYSGDHHIHGAGCAHYDNPTKGVTPEDMFLQVKGEGLNVGCVLTWGPCFDFQRHYFSPVAKDISEPLTVLKYDLEISGFGSAALGHVCLLNLSDQTYPGSEGSKLKGWPSWTVPVMRWCKQQGGVTGYPHSALYVDPPGAARWYLEALDANTDGVLDRPECDHALLPAEFATVDEDRSGDLTERELHAAVDRAADELPNLAPPGMTGAGAMEVFVSTAEGVCDFISAMDTARIPEWNTWYHLLNCGFPLKLSGETDFPCMSSRRVGQGRVYVHLGAVHDVDFVRWCNGIAAGRAYVSDGYAHAVGFSVAGTAPGYGDVHLEKPGSVAVTAQVAFAPETPKTVAQGQLAPAAGRRWVGDTVNLHAPRTGETVQGGTRRVELVVNGRAVADRNVPADGAVHDLRFSVDVEQSSWIALRHFPQLHTNPVNVLVAGRPIRASRNSARWCAQAVQLLWRNRSRHIAEAERAAARDAYDRALDRYLHIAAEAPSD